MTAISILVSEYRWSNYSSWMRTMNVSHTPSEWIVQHVVRVRMRLPEVEDASERVESAAEE